MDSEEWMKEAFETKHTIIANLRVKKRKAGGVAMLVAQRAALEGA